MYVLPNQRNGLNLEHKQIWLYKKKTYYINVMGINRENIEIS